jgi:hypothetical protein
MPDRMLYVGAFASHAEKVRVDHFEKIEKGGMNMDVKKVLWPTDFSSSAEKALPYVTSLTQKYQAEIHVLYVIEDIAHHESWYGDFDRTHVDKLMAWAEKSAAKRLEQVCEKYLEGWPAGVRKDIFALGVLPKKWSKTPRFRSPPSLLRRRKRP